MGIPDDDAEHAAQVVDYVLAPVVVAHHDGLAIALGVEGVAETLELLAQLHVVVDFTIKGHGVAVGLVLWAPAEGLMGMLQVNNGQAVEAESGIAVMPRAGRIWAAVAHAGQGTFQRVNVLIYVACGGEHAKKSAHVKIAPYI